MTHDPSSFWTKARSRRRFAKVAVLAPVAGVLSATALSAQPLLAHAQIQQALGLQQAQSVTGTWSLTSPLPAARTEHTATLLLNGKVLVSGG